MMTIFRIITLLLLAHATTFAQAKVYSHRQDEVNPVTWKFDSRQEKRNVYTLSLRASIKAGWHIYSSAMAEGGPLPTHIRFTSSPQWQLNGSLKERGPKVHYYDSAYAIQVVWFEDSVIFTQRIKMKKNQGVAVAGELEYMACREELCLPPKILAFSIHIPERK